MQIMNINALCYTTRSIFLYRSTFLKEIFDQYIGSQLRIQHLGLADLRIKTKTSRPHF